MEIPVKRPQNEFQPKSYLYNGGLGTMSLRVARVLACMCTLGISACGTASVQYGKPLPSQTTSADSASSVAILAAVTKGNQTLVLPESRLVVVGTVAPAGNGGAVLGPASPPSDQAPAAAPNHAARGAAARKPKPAQIGTQPASQAANQSGGTQPAKSADSTTPAPSVTTTLTSDDNTTKYAVNVVQVESAISFMVQPTNNFFSENDFSVTRLANTRIPTTVSNTFTDETASRIKTIASIAAAVAPLAAAAAPPHGNAAASGTPQCLSDDLVVDDDAASGGWSARKTTWTLSGKCMDITLTADPLAANLVPVATLADAFPGKSADWTKVWPVPACMSVHVVITPHGLPADKSASGQITVIDPDYVELMPIPKKGKIAMHPICGADLADSATDPYQADFDTISAIVAAFPSKTSSKTTGK
jgi:hypothetical protein